MTSFGTQRNGLSVECVLDAIGVHDFADEDTWEEGTSDSAWTLEPSSATAPTDYKNKVVKLTGMQLDLSEDIDMPSGSELLVEFFGYLPNDLDTELKLKTVTYAKMTDWISRAHTKTPIKNDHGAVGDYTQYDIRFPIPPIFWSSRGVDATGGIKMSKMVIRISNNLPYKKASDALVNATIAKPRYFVEIYEDPDL